MRSKAILTVMAVLVALMVAGVASFAGAQTTCKSVAPTQDLDAVINADSGNTATVFCLKAGTYNVDNPAVLKSGDALIGPVGTTVTRASAVYPNPPAAKIVGVSGVPKILSLNGPDIEVAWVDISGAQGRIDQNANNANCPSSNITVGCPVVGEGVAIAMGSANGTASVHHVRVHNNDAVGISNAKGRTKNSEFFANTEMSAYLNVNGSAIKGITEYEAANNYVHDEQGMGIWFDHAILPEANDPAMASNPTGGGWVHHNVIVNTHQYAMRHEFAPHGLNEGEHSSVPTFLWERNRVAGTEINAGMSIRDAQNSLVRNNTFGPQTIAGVSYGNNLNRTAVVASDSGRNDRTDLWNVDILNNTLNGEQVKGCELPDNVVFCSGNQ